MSETAVRVDLRQANLSESAKLREAEDHVFIALEQPPPVRSLLRLTIGEERKAFEVQRVVEVASDDEPARGCYGSFVDVERLEEQTKVGSEHLQPGNVGGGGVPAPVVIMTTEEMMLGEAGSEESEAAAAAAAGAEPDGGENGDASVSDAPDASDGDASDASASDSDASDGEPDASDDTNRDESD